MKIRLAGPADLPTILALGERMHAESRFRHYGLNRAKAASAMEKLIANPSRAVVLLAENSTGVAVGMLSGYVIEYFFCDATAVQDRVFFVVPEARGSSAAMKLLLAFRRWAEARKVDELSINMSVGVEMERFNRMMGKLGFACCGSNFSLQLRKG